MKTEPLKGKERGKKLLLKCGILEEDIEKDYTTIYHGNDIKSAVEWLKEDIKRRLVNNLTGIDGQILNPINKSIDKAFEDVMK